MILKLKCVGYLLNEEFEAADNCANILEYKVLELELPFESVFGLVPNRELQTSGELSARGKLRRGFYFIRRDTAVLRNIATSAAHPRADYKTGHIMASFFDFGTRSFAVIGVHRCFSNDESPCDGTTTMCGASGKFRTSDSAHNDNSFFQFFNEAVFDQFRLTKTKTISSEEQLFVHLQQHGMSPKSSADHFVSNGVVSGTSSSGYQPRFEGGVANDLADFLSQELPAYADENGLDAAQQYNAHSCNNDAHAGQVSLCASTNTLGRFVSAGYSMFKLPCMIFLLYGMSHTFIQIHQPRPRCARPSGQEFEIKFRKLIRL